MDETNKSLILLLLFYYYYYFIIIIIIIIITIIIIIDPLGQMECKEMRSKYEKVEVDLETPQIAMSIYL